MFDTKRRASTIPRTPKVQARGNPWLAVHRSCALAALLALFLMGITTQATATTPPGPQSLCSYRYAHNYLAPLRKMAPIRRAPSSEHLPFAPPSFEFGHFGSPLIVGRSAFGYSFSDSLRTRLPIKLGWIVTTRLLRVNQHGRVERLLLTRERNIGIVKDINDLSFIVPVPHRPAFYRYDISFKDKHGALGYYSEYLRVMRPKVEVQLRTDQLAYAPGDTLWFRLENLGTTPITFGLPFVIEHYVGSEWVKEPEVPDSLIAIEMGGGGAYECRKVTLAPDMSPGLYRVSQRVWPGLSRKALNPVAEFEVVG